MKYCLIGKTLSHSYSAVLHGGYGLDYGLVEIAPDLLGNWVQQSGYDGYNVTIPYKRDIIPYLHALSPLAARLGAVNTVVNANGKLTGYNTDYVGFAEALHYHGLEVAGRHALVLGTGGASAVVQAVLEDLGAASVMVVSRTGNVNYDNCYNLANTQIIVNATPVGTYPHVEDTPLDVGRYPNLQWVYDLVYNPYRTRLVLDARAKGARAHNGLSMLVIQALAAEKIWLGKDYDRQEIQTCIRRLLGDTLNIALMGMPSAGKSTIGKALAEALGRAVLDTDAMITQAAGRTPGAIIREDGEAAFREIEAKTVAEACAKRGVVLSLGGGSILLDQNRHLLRGTALVVYIRRDLSALNATDRPTLAAAGAQELYARRNPIYQGMADLTIDNNGSIQDAVKQICIAYENLSY